MIIRHCLLRLLVGVSVFTSCGAFAETEGVVQDRYNSLFVRQEMLHKGYKDIYLTLTDINQKDALSMWYGLFFQNVKNQRRYSRTSKQLASIVLGKDFRDLLIYYAATKQYDNAKKTVGLYFLSVQTLLDNYQHNPQALAWGSLRGVEFEHFMPGMGWFTELKNVETCMDETLRKDRYFDALQLRALHKGIEICLKKSVWARYLVKNLETLYEEHHFYGAPFPVSFAGTVGYNAIEILSQIPEDRDSILKLGEQLTLVKSGVHTASGKIYSQMSVADFKAEMQKPQDAIDNFFTADEGFLDFETHPSFQAMPDGSANVFRDVVQSIRDAKESVFIDVFWIGGSLGVNLAKELIQKTLKQPDFKVYIVTDNENKFTYRDEIDTVYNYLKAYSESFLNLDFYVVAAEVTLKRTALPEYVDLLITDNVITDFSSIAVFKKLLDESGYQLLAKSDHSKIMVVDGLNPDLGIAYVGSKNWTDSSGGIATDEVAKIEGPAVAMVLDAYYYDAFEAFRSDSRLPEGTVFPRLSRISGFGGTWPMQTDGSLAIQQMLSGMDVMGRWKGQGLESTLVPFVPKSSESAISIAQNNVYGTEVSALAQNIQAILGAQTQILIDDQFLYDIYIFEALKAAIQRHGVQVYIMLHPLTGPLDPNPTLAHFPNNIFIPELVELGAKVKWKLTSEEVSEAVVDVAESEGHSLSPEFHLKSLSVDGLSKSEFAVCHGEKGASIDWTATKGVPALITGSANKDVMTMSGGFREFQTMIFDTGAVLSHDCNFWKRWLDPKLSQSTDGLDFDLPAQAESMGVADQQSFLDLARTLIFGAYDFTKFMLSGEDSP